jgi:hypothetical protein
MQQNDANEKKNAARKIGVVLRMHLQLQQIFRSINRSSHVIT